MPNTINELLGELRRYQATAQGENKPLLALTPAMIAKLEKVATASTPERTAITISISQTTRMMLESIVFDRLLGTGKKPTISALIEAAILNTYDSKGSRQAAKRPDDPPARKKAAPKPTTSHPGTGPRAELLQAVKDFFATPGCPLTKRAMFKAIGTSETGWTNWVQRGVVPEAVETKVREWLAANAL